MTDQPTPPIKRLRTSNRLSDAAIRAAVKDYDKTEGAARKLTKLQDGGGLWLLLKPDGARYWQVRVRFDGRDTTIQLGKHPDMGLAKARTAAADALAPGKGQPGERKDPAAVRKLQKLRDKLPTDDSFAAVGREWLALKSPDWSDTHRERETRNLEGDLIPWLGKRRIGDIEAPELLAVVRKVEERGALNSAKRVMGTARAILSYAITTGRAQRNPALDLQGALKGGRAKHFAAITDPVELAGLLRAMQGYAASPVVRAALLLTPLLFQRPSELRCAKWGEFDLDAALWAVPAARMKRTKDGKENGDPHLVPLPRQAVAMLRDLHKLTGTDADAWVFPGQRPNRSISDNSLRAALQTLGYWERQSIHGFRATARTLLDEVLEFDIHIIEAHLAHAVKDANGRSYNRTRHINQRAAMIQAWADWLDALRLGNNAKVTPFKASAAN